MNVFGNALKYTDSGYVLVQLCIKEGSQDDLRARTANASGSILLISIKDSGRGMSSEYMERKLFHPFAQEDSFSAGIGLGLSIV